jgi:HEAT repeat protein
MLEEALVAFGEGQVRAQDVSLLSDLSLPAARDLAARWPTFTEESRERVTRLMGELAEDRVELHFGRALRVALEDPSAVVRQLAVAALWEDDGADLGAAFLDLLRHDPSQDVRAEAAHGLARFADRAVEEGDGAQELRSSLREVAGWVEEAPLVRRRALEAVAVFPGDAGVAELIEDAYEADDIGLRSGAIRAMGRSLDRRWLGTVIDELASDDAEVRFEAARACGEFGNERAVLALSEAAQDDDPEVRAAAVTALGQIGGRAAVRVLRALESAAQEEERPAIQLALEEATAGEDPRGMGR